VGEEKSEVLQGTLDLMVLKTLHALGPLHGFGIARRLEQLSGDVLARFIPRCSACSSRDGLPLLGARRRTTVEPASTPSHAAD